MSRNKNNKVRSRKHNKPQIISNTKIRRLHKKANTTTNKMLYTTTKTNTIVKPLERTIVKNNKEPMRGTI